MHGPDEPGVPVAISISCSATVTHPDGTTDEDESEGR
jgi:hypothetical protein